MGAVGDEPSSNVPPVDADEDVTGELGTAELLALVQAIAQGNTVALTSLYDATVGKVVAVARAVLRNVEDAEEVTCDVYTQAWETARHFDETRGSVLGWLLTIARNRSIDLLRQRQRRERAIAAEKAPEDAPDERVLGSPEDLLGLFQSGMAVHAVLGALTPLRRGWSAWPSLAISVTRRSLPKPDSPRHSEITHPRALYALRDSLER
jgi:RNA polymerase sigma-70 factor (ECF subfamily)